MAKKYISENKSKNGSVKSLPKNYKTLLKDANCTGKKLLQKTQSFH